VLVSIQDLIPDVFKLETLLEKAMEVWFKSPKEAFIKISVENFIEDLLKHMFYEEAIHEFVKLLRPEDCLGLYSAFQLFDPEYLLKYVIASLKASSLRDRIILCHDKLGDHLISLLREVEIKVHKVRKALEEAKRRGIISESDYKLLKELNKLRGQAHHGTYLSRYSEKSLEELEREIKEAESVIKQIIDKGKVKSGILKDLAKCLEEPLPLSDMILSSLIE